MAIRKVVTKLTSTSAVVKVVNDADAADTITITLATDLLKSNESLVAGVTPEVSIKRIEWSVQDQIGYAFIKRNGVMVDRLHSTNLLDMGFCLDSDNNQYDIEVTMTGGTVYFVLDKMQGYLYNFQPEQHGGE